MVEQKYKNKKAILMASGPSLTEEVIETIRPYKDDFVIFGCNDIYRVVDFLDVHYACDTQWWDTWGKDVKERRPNLESWTQCKSSSEKYKINYIKGQHKPELSISNNKIHYGSNSGYQQLNLAFLMGCSYFILVGYNMQRISSKTHYFGDHPKNLQRNSPYHKFIAAFKTIQPEIKELITNCTTNSALTMFKQKDLRDTLCE